MNGSRYLPFLLLFTFSYTLPGVAQVEVPYFGRQELINGYARTISGETIPYFSVYPQYAREALLTRATDGKKTIEWETDPIPAGIRGDYAYFTWIASHSTGSSSGERKFDLFINDHYVLTFSTFPRNYPAWWTFGANDSTRLVFAGQKKDGAGDAHGMAWLRVPLSAYPKGKGLRLKIVGQHQESNDWYMTFQYAFREKVEFRPLPFLLRGGKNDQQPLHVIVLHFGSPQTLRLTIGKGAVRQFPVQHGFNAFDVPVTAVKETMRLPVKTEIPGLLKLDSTIVLNPVIYREIDLVHNAHTDIGYSHIQEDVIQIHNNNIRQAFRLIEKTRGYPEGSRFVWNIESAWAAENFWESANETERKEFLRCLKDGQIVLSATYANMLTGLCTPEEMSWITEYTRNLHTRYGLSFKTAMMSDVPGMSGSMVSALAKSGVRYFSNGPNYTGSRPYLGDRIGHTLLAQGDKAFWWKSSDTQDSILFWTAGKGYSSWHGTPPGGVADRGAGKIADYLDELAAAQYPYSMVQWRYNIVADNGPTDSTISSFVRSWNEKYQSPRLVLSNVTDMFERFEKLYGNKIPSFQGDFTPFWEDGAYSTAREEGEARLASEELLGLEQLARHNKLSVDSAWWYRARRGIVLFHEHTWGAWNSISDPDNPFVLHQWKYKKAFLDTALYYTGKIRDQIYRGLAVAGKLVVYNTLDHARSGYVELDWPASFHGNQVRDEQGRLIPVQRMANGRLGLIAADVPARGHRVYSLVAAAGEPVKSFDSAFRYQLDPASGAIGSLQALGKDWADTGSYHGLAQALYVSGLDPAKYSSTAVQHIGRSDGPVSRTAEVSCSMAGAKDLVYTFEQYNGLPWLHVSLLIDKKSIREKESVHIAFPFRLDSALVRIGMDQSFFTPEQGQLPGSNRDFYSVQRWLDVSGPQYGVTLVSPQGALFEIGSPVNEERTAQGSKQWKTSSASASTLFLYALNNYWHTNYKADQEGRIRFDCYLLFHRRFDADSARQFGYELTQPLIGIAGE